MRPVSTLELDTVAGGVVVAFASPIRITASNTAGVAAGQLNVNVAGAAAQGGSVTVGQGIAISL